MGDFPVAGARAGAGITAAGAVDATEADTIGAGPAGAATLSGTVVGGADTDTARTGAIVTAGAAGSRALAGASGVAGVAGTSSSSPVVRHAALKHFAPDRKQTAQHVLCGHQAQFYCEHRIAVPVIILCCWCFSLCVAVMQTRLVGERQGLRSTGLCCRCGWVLSGRYRWGIVSRLPLHKHAAADPGVDRTISSWQCGVMRTSTWRRQHG